MRKFVCLAMICTMLLLGGDVLRGATIPPDVKKTVVFIFRPTLTPGRYEPNGTGFFVLVKDESNRERGHGYLVTARHVLQDQTGKMYQSVAVRLNRIDGKADLIELKLGAGGAPIFTHPTDNTVDLAVIPALPDQKIYDMKFLPDDFLTTKESFKSLNLGEGADIFFEGLFTSYIGQERNYPISRFGRVAMIPAERVPWRERNKPVEFLDLYLMESQSYGGNSGAPVFYYLGADRVPGSIIVGPPELKLAGIIKGSFNEGAPDESAQQNAVISVPLQNIGISAVIPSNLLHEILFSDVLVRQRAIPAPPKP